MMETISILFIFFIIVVIALIFYYNIAKSGAQDQLDKFQDLSRIQIAQIASSLPELQCAQNNIVKANCIDILKMDAAAKEGGNVISGNLNDYFDLFAYSNITVQDIFPGDTRQWTIYERKPDTIAAKRVNFFPISLYNATADTYAFGLMVVEVYS